MAGAQINVTGAVALQIGATWAVADGEAVQSLDAPTVFIPTLTIAVVESVTATDAPTLVLTTGQSLHAAEGVAVAATATLTFPALNAKATESVVTVGTTGENVPGWSFLVAVLESVVTLDIPGPNDPGGTSTVADVESVTVIDVPSLVPPYNKTLPIALSLPASAITNYSAFLNGSINPEANIVRWWFDWGLTQAYGQSTPILQMPASAFPTNVGATIGSLSLPLTTGTVYHFRVTALTGAGTVHGVDETFTASVAPVVSSAGLPLVPYGPPIGIPHLAYPLIITANGAETAQQGSLQEVFACVQAIANCTVGDCPQLPGFGIPDIAFVQGPPATNALVTAIQNLEPRADETTIVSAADTIGADWTIAADTSVTGAPLI